MLIKAISLFVSILSLIISIVALLKSWIVQEKLDYISQIFWKNEKRINDISHRVNDLDKGE